LDAQALYGDDVEKMRPWLVLVVWLLGIAMLFPWNVFINATAFWKLRLTGSPFVDNFQRFGIPPPPPSPPLYIYTFLMAGVGVASIRGASFFHLLVFVLV